MNKIIVCILLLLVSNTVAFAQDPSAAIKSLLKVQYIAERGMGGTTDYTNAVGDAYAEVVVYVASQDDVQLATNLSNALRSYMAVTDVPTVVGDDTDKFNNKQFAEASSQLGGIIDFLREPIKNVKTLPSKKDNTDKGKVFVDAVVNDILKTHANNK